MAIVAHVLQNDMDDLNGVLSEVPVGVASHDGIDGARRRPVVVEIMLEK